MNSPFAGFLGAKIHIRFYLFSYFFKKPFPRLLRWLELPEARLKMY